jgi:hypothetical protein
MVDKKIGDFHIANESASMRPMEKAVNMRPLQRNTEAIVTSNTKANTPSPQPSAPANHSQELSKTKPDRR